MRESLRGLAIAARGLPIGSETEGDAYCILPATPESSAENDLTERKSVFDL